MSITRYGWPTFDLRKIVSVFCIYDSELGLKVHWIRTTSWVFLLQTSIVRLKWKARESYFYIFRIAVFFNVSFQTFSKLKLACRTICIITIVTKIPTFQSNLSYSELLPLITPLLKLELVHWYWNSRSQLFCRDRLLAYNFVNPLLAKVFRGNNMGTSVRNVFKKWHLH